MDEMRRIPQQQVALLQSGAHQSHAPLGQVADAAVNELRAATGCSLGKVVLLDDQRPVTARRRVDPRAKPCCAASDDDDIPQLASVRHGTDRLVAVHLGIIEIRLETAIGLRLRGEPSPAYDMLCSRPMPGLSGM